MIRRLFTAASLVSLLLLLILSVGVAAFWCRSARTMDEVILTTPGRRLIDLTSFGGKLDIDTMRGWPNAEKVHFLSASPPQLDLSGDPRLYPSPPYPVPDTEGIGTGGWSWHGLIFTRTTRRVRLNADRTAHWTMPGSVDWDYWKSGPHLSGGMAGLSIEVPYWMLASLFAGPLALSMLLWGLPVVKRRRRIRRGLCAACGYDLRGSSERCPECGTPMNPHKRASA